MRRWGRRLAPDRGFERSNGGRARWPGPGAVLATTLIAVAVLIGVLFVYLIRDVLLLILVSVLLATAIEPLVNLLRRGPFSKGQGILLVYTGIMATIGTLALLTVPALATEVGRMVEQLPETVAGVRALAEQLPSLPLRRLALSALEEAAPLWRGNPPVGPESAVAAGLGVAERLFSALTVFVVAYYWLTERPLIKRTLLMLFPLPRRQRARLIWDDVEARLGGWVRGQLLLMLVIGAASAVGYTALGVKYSLILAVWAAAMEIVPIVGPFLGAAPAVAVALTQGPGLALMVTGFAVALQFVEGNLLVPRVMQASVGITPLTVLVGILIGSTVAGLPGAMLAVPLAGAIQVVLQHLLAGADSPADGVAGAPPNGWLATPALEARGRQAGERPRERTRGRSRR